MKPAAPVATAMLFVLAFPSIGSAATAPGGTSSTELLGLNIGVTDASGTQALGLLKLNTFASTDADATRNVPGAGLPFASVSLVPAQFGGTDVGAVTVTSGAESGSSAPVVIADPSGLVSIKVDGGTFTATASETEALAIAQPLVGSVGIAELVESQLTASGVTSGVTSTSSFASQGATLSSFGIGLADLIPADVLAALPLDAILDLLALIPVGAPDIQGVIDAVLAAVDAVGGAADAVESAAADLATALTEFASATAELTDAQALVDELTDALADAEATLTSADAVAGELAADLAALNPATLPAMLVEYAECSVVLNPLDIPGTTSALSGCISGLLADAQAEVDAATGVVDDITADLADAVSALDDLAALVDSLTDIVNDLVEAIVGLVNDLLDVLNDLLAALLNLDGSLDDVLDALLGAELINIGDITAGVVAVSTGDVATSEATTICRPVNVTILGQSVATDGCESLDNLVADFNGLLGSLSDILGVLPVVGDVIPEISLAIFPENVESIVQDGAYVAAEAGLTLLRFAVDSVELDPQGLVDSLLDSLLATGSEALAALEGAASDLLGSNGLGQVGDLLSGVLGTVGGAVGDVESQIGDLISSLAGVLPEITLPGLEVEGALNSIAEFRPAGTVGPAPAPTPNGGVPTDTSLPTTGGGAGLFVVAILGAAMLRRRSRRTA